MAITYDAGTNTITTVGYTEATPCTFIDIYNADKAGTLSLHARTGITAADTDPVAVDRAERPADYIVLGGTSNDLYITIANWSGTTATIRITGTDRDGTSQTEDIVVTANGDYYTTKWFKTITQTQVTAFTGTSFDYELIQGQWGVVWNQGTKEYAFDAILQIGDGTTVTWFADTQKFISFTDTVSWNWVIDVKASGHFRIGKLIDASNKVSGEGCSIYFNNAYYFIRSAEPVEIYSSLLSISGLYGWLILSSGSKIWNSVLEYCFLKSADCEVINTVNRRGKGAEESNVVADNWIIMDVDRGIDARYTYVFTIKNVKIINATVDFFFLVLEAPCYAINVECGWNIDWSGSSSYYLYRQYEFDLKVIDKDNTPINAATVKIWDKDSTLVVDTTTDANGVIATQTITRGYYDQEDGSTLQEYSPHRIKVEKAGYTTYEADFTLEKTDWTIALQGVLKRNPAMTGGMV